jgi:hypothetical protein
MLIVECNSVSEFCQELAREALAGGVREAVRVRVDTLPEQADEVSFKVGVWATALIQKQNACYILEAAIVCRESDYVADPPEKRLGMAEAEAHKAAVRRVCEEHGLVLAGGKWE